MSYTNDDQNGIGLDINNGMSPADAAQKWIDANPTVWQPWVAAGLAAQPRERTDPVRRAGGGGRCGRPRSVSGGLMSEEVRLFIGGSWADAENGAVFEATSPSTGEVIGTVAEGTRADAQRAVDAANAAAPGWAALSAFDRAAAMKRVAVRHRRAP